MNKLGTFKSNSYHTIIISSILALTSLISISCGGGGNLSANAVSQSPSADLSPASVTFASKAVGTPTTAQIVTVNNSGNADMSVSSIAISGTDASDFSQTNTCGASLAAGANCTISVTFKPAATGTRTAAINLIDDAHRQPLNLQTSCRGRLPRRLPAASLRPACHWEASPSARQARFRRSLYRIREVGA